MTADAHMPADWARTLVDPDAFGREQDSLAHVWTLLGRADEIASDGDWFRATLATRSVFVQRFGTELRGFENRCIHRFYPLRTADKGSGPVVCGFRPVVCGFHHWRYDKDGRALGIPLAAEMFGAAPRDIGACLNPIEVATCGSLIFGRFPGTQAKGSLEEFLGEGFAVLAAMSRSAKPPHYLTRPVQANWRLCCHITLDDYHGVAVHPDTFGKNGYPVRQNMGYFRFGMHSVFTSTPEPDAFARIVAGVGDGTFWSSHYFIMLIFPNLVVSHFRSDAQYWHITVQQYSPRARDRTLLRAWNYPATFPANHVWHDKWTRPFTDPWRAIGVRYYYLKILHEDHAVCERIQAVASQIGQAPILGNLEERVVWFEEAYAKAVPGATGERAAG